MLLSDLKVSRTVVITSFSLPSVLGVRLVGQNSNSMVRVGGRVLNWPVLAALACFVVCADLFIDEER